MSPPRAAVKVRRIHAEPADESLPSAPSDEVAWLALWPTGAVTHHVNARALLRAAKRRDRRDAARADRQRRAVIFITAITWHNTPAGFVPPTSGSEE